MKAFGNRLSVVVVAALVAGFGSEPADHDVRGVSDQNWINRLHQGLAQTPDDARRVRPDVEPSLVAEDLPTARNLHALIPERYPNTVALPDLIRQLAATEEGRAQLDELLMHIEAATGLPIDPELVDHYLAHPELLLDFLQFTPRQLAAIRDLAVLLLEETGGLPPLDFPLPSVLTSEYQLPSVFDYAAIAEVPFEVPPDDLIPLLDGVYLGVLRDHTIPAAQLRDNYIFAEVVERLGMNLRAHREKQFTVVYEGVAFTRLSDFVDALLDNGHLLSAKLRHYVAPFIPMYAMGKDGSLRPVAATVFLRTGFKDAEGMEAALPLFHSELVFGISPSPDTEAQGITAFVQYYQGIPKTGFYGEGSMARPQWLGEVVTDDTFTSNEAGLALLLAGTLVDVTRAVAEGQNMPFDGWGITGVCNDSSAIVQQAVHGEVTSYPLFMRDDLLVRELEDRLSAVSGNDTETQLNVETYHALLASIRNAPEDIDPTPSALMRLLSSFPWEPGREPFVSAVDARRIVEQAAGF